MGEALAKQSKGIAYVLMLKGKLIADFGKNFEYPSLHENGVKITGVDAKNLEDTEDYVPDKPFKRGIIV